MGMTLKTGLGENLVAPEGGGPTSDLVKSSQVLEAVEANKTGSLRYPLCESEPGKARTVFKTS